LARRGRREAILDAAMDLFAHSRSGGVTIQEIADAAETHKTTLLYHFPSKEILFEAVLERALEPVIVMMEGFLANEFTPDRLGWYLDELHRFLRDNPSIPRLLMRELDYGDTYADHFVRVFTPAQKRLAEAEKSGMIAHLEPVFFVHDLHVQIMTYFCHGPLLERLMGADPYSVDAMIERRNYLVDQIVRQWRPGRAQAAAAPPVKGQTKRRVG
jgi:TetR/AcrR family transcriptional regulator